MKLNSALTAKIILFGIVGVWRNTYDMNQITYYERILNLPKKECSWKKTNSINFNKY